MTSDISTHRAAIRDLGRLDQPLLVFGGAYGNREAARALLAAAAGHGIPPARILCTGDLVAYCADPTATDALVCAAVPAVAEPARAVVG